MSSSLSPIAVTLGYPRDWSAIAYKAKQKVNWTCQWPGCGKHPPEYPARLISVHHLDHNTFNSSDDNLLVLCAQHHLAYEQKHLKHLKQERLLNTLQASGQSLLPGLNPYPTSE